MVVELDERYWSKVALPDCDDQETCIECCWTWTAAKTYGGYGLFWHPTSSRNERVHVLSYCDDRGLDLEDLPADPSVSNDKRIAVTHLCDFPACVNPAHLVVYDDGHAGAIRYRTERGRSASGERHGSKTPEGRARAFRMHELRAEHPNWTMQAIADEVGMKSPGAVSNTLSGKRWPEVKREFEGE